MAYIRIGELRRLRERLAGHVLMEARQALEKTASTEVTVFLSHSHHDADLVEQARMFLGAQGIRVYVDWKDPSMPAVTSPETASKLKNRITACDKFVVLASVNALGSKWVPWELGFADPVKTMDNIAVFPVADDHGRWKGSEYIGVYPRITSATDGNWVVLPHGASGGPRLSRWLRR